MPNTHGGAGRGQGRKAISPDEKPVRVTVTLLPSTIAALKKINPDNLSDAIRTIVARQSS